MFDVAISTQTFRSMLTALSAFVDEVMFVVDNDGMSAAAVDAANAALVSMNIPESKFLRYEVSDTEFGIDLRRFVEIMGMADKDGEVSMMIDDDTHRLCIDMGGLAYMMSLLDPSTIRKSPNVPDLQLPAEIVLSGGTFKRVIKAAKNVGDTMEIGVSGEGVFMEARGDTDSVRLDLATEDLVSLKAADVSATYSIDYLTDVSRGIGAAPEITMYVGRDLPLVVDFATSPHCNTTYVIAPRIEPEG